MLDFSKQFEEYYRNWFSKCKASQLVKYEQNLSQFIDSDFYDEFVLCDEVNILYDLVRDECVYRVANMSEFSIDP